MESLYDWLDRQDLYICWLCMRDDEDNRIEFFYEELNEEQVQELMEKWAEDK